jgi:hypothetical protein
MGDPRALGEPTCRERGNLLRHDDANETPDRVFGRLNRPPMRLRGNDARHNGIMEREYSLRFRQDS